ncbi:helix-turn-helix domain-containing protein [Acrocarpospora catenulata]|uniref:helix-turn-helix domain-containing protein n=1 Tax=Acrocarpospora catenulata TaxID=2836182 RepID=UPI001BD949C2|nr:helix-turn-helix domain-containing protein [Acrocarpospora catenulata]
MSRPPTFATQLRLLREQAGMSRRELARRVGCERLYIEHLELGIAHPPGRDLAARFDQELDGGGTLSTLAQEPQPGLTPELLDAELDRRADARRTDRLSAFAPETLAILALLPEWTESLASRISFGRDNVQDLLDQLIKQDLVELRPTLGEDGAEETTFWLHPAARTEVSAYLRRVHPAVLPRARTELCAQLWRIARPPETVDLDRVPPLGQYLAINSPPDLPALRDDFDELFITAGFDRLRNWYRVAELYVEDPSGIQLVQETSRRVESGDVPGAARLVAVARMLGETLGGHLGHSARRAAWRVSRAEREAEDVHFLRHYLRRREIENALAASILPGSSSTRTTIHPSWPMPVEVSDRDLPERTLAEGGEAQEPDRPVPWAVHLLGEGGMGKTMLVRYLMSGRFARDRGLEPFPVARIDFDHLDPRYPEDRPGEILVALAAELLGFVESRDAEARYNRFREAVDRLHEELSRREREGSVVDRLLEEAVAGFTRFAAELSRPAVLVLDTCEELAKLYPPRSPAPAIEVTFRVLELIHARMPEIRVVLAGRRWLTPSSSDEENAAGPVLLPRGYLRVVPVAGFTEDEAAGYLAERAVLTGQRSAILARALMSEQLGFNPFDLAAYTEWALSDPDLDLSGTSGDPYIERRIIGRISETPIARALAVVAELGRFDRPLITPALHRLGLDPDLVFDDLAAQEWIQVVELGPDGRPSIIEVDAHLRDRLRTTTSAAPTRFPLTRPQLGRDAATVIQSAPSLDTVPVSTVLAAVRLLPLPEAAALWSAIEDRTVRENAWAWAANVTTRVAAETTGDATGGMTPTILAAVLATQASARIHTGGGGVAEIWRQVEEYAERHPTQARTLAARAFLGLAAAGVKVPLDERLPGILAEGAAPPGSLVAAIDGWMRDGIWGELKSGDLRPLIGDTALPPGPGREHHPRPRIEDLDLPLESERERQTWIPPGLGRERKDLDPSPDWERQVWIAPDSNWFATTSGTGVIEVWKPDGSALGRVDGEPGQVDSLAVSPDSSWFVAPPPTRRPGSTPEQAGRLRLWRPDGAVRADIVEDSGDIISVAIAPDGSWLATVASSGTARLWNSSDGTPLATLHGRDMFSGALRLSIAPEQPTRRDIASDIDSSLPAQLSVESPCLVIAPDGTWLAGRSRREDVHIWNTDGTLRAVLPSGPGLPILPPELTSIETAPDSSWLACLDGKGEIDLWEPDGILRGTLTREHSRFTGLTISPDGKWLVTTSTDGIGQLWNADGTLRTNLMPDIDRFLIAPDATWFATHSRDGKVRLWNPDGTTRQELAGVRAHSLAIAPHSSWLAVARDGIVELLDAEERQGSYNHDERGHVKVRPDGEVTIRIAPSGAWFTTSSLDGEVRIWNADRMVSAVALAQSAVLALRENPEQAGPLAESALMACGWAGDEESAWWSQPSQYFAPLDEIGQLARKGVIQIPPGGRYADWLPPESPFSRVQLARLLIAGLQGQDVQEACGTLLSSASHYRELQIGDGLRIDYSHRAVRWSVDLDRLHSLAVHLLLGHGLVQDSISEVNFDYDRRATDTCNWLHDTIPPLMVSNAEYLTILNHPDQAADYLVHWLDAAVSAGDDAETTEQCQIALIRLCRRYRTLRYFPQVSVLANTGTPLVRAEAWTTLALVTGRQPQSPEEAGSWYGWWQSQDSVSIREEWRFSAPYLGEPAIPDHLLRESIRELEDFRGVTPRPGPPTPREFRPDLDEQRPGSRGRAALARAEILALRFPERAAAILSSTVADLREAGDITHAAQALVLAGLATVRTVPSGEPLPPATAEALIKILDELSGPYATALASGDSGWPDRATSLADLVAGQPSVLAVPECTRPNRVSPPDVPDTTELPLGVRPDPGSNEAHWADGVDWPVADPDLWVDDIPEKEPDFRLRWTVGPLPTLAALAALAVPLLGGPWWITVVALLGLTSTLSGVVHPPKAEGMTLRVNRHGGNPWKVERVLQSSFAAWESPWTNQLTRWRIVHWQSGRLETVDTVHRLDLEHFPDITLSTPFPREERPGIVRLDVPPGLDQGAWEQWLGANANSDLRRMPLWFRLLGRPVEGGWYAGRDAQGQYQYIGPPHLYASTTTPRKDKGPGMTHIVGSPVPTGSEWRMGIYDDDPQYTESGTSRRDRRLISARDLKPGELALIVLQANPVDGPPRPLGDQRYGFVAFARQLIAEGARAVLIIPPLPDDVARLARDLCRTYASGGPRPARPTVVALTRSLRWMYLNRGVGQPGPMTYLRMLRPLRNLIAGHEPTREGERALFDLIMFLPD